MDHKAFNKLTKARIQLLLKNPFYAVIALKLELKEDPGCNPPTAWTDGKHLGYNPAWINTLTGPGDIALVAHEICHVCYLHNLRQGNRNHDRWNAACDYAINPILKNAGFELPDGGLLDSKYDGMSAEQIYNLLPADTQAPDYGSVRKPEHADGTAMTEAEIKQIENDTRVLVSQAAQAAKAAGSYSGDIDRLVKSLLQPKIDWQDILKDKVSTVMARKADYTWTRPNRRYMSTGLYLPAAAYVNTGDVIVAVDTSGSISQKELEQITAEINGMLETYPGLTITVIYCDSDIKGTEEFCAFDAPVVLNAKGGGGTEFDPVFKYIEDAKLACDTLIYFTDFCGDLTVDAPEYPVIWILDNLRHTLPPWGEVIAING